MYHEFERKKIQHAQHVNDKLCHRGIFWLPVKFLSAERRISSSWEYTAIEFSRNSWAVSDVGILRTHFRQKYKRASKIRFHQKLAWESNLTSFYWNFGRVYWIGVSRQYVIGSWICIENTYWPACEIFISIWQIYIFAKLLIGRFRLYNWCSWQGKYAVRAHLHCWNKSIHRSTW